MSSGGRGGGGWSDDPDWGRSMPRGQGGRPPRRPPPDYDDPWAGPVSSPGPRRRAAIHDPWTDRRGFNFPFPTPSPLVLGAIALFVFAFILGRCTAGGGDGGEEISTTNTTVAPSTTVLTAAPIIHTVKENETLAAIASRYAVTINDITIANNIGDQNNIFVGQQLKIPQTPPSTLATTTTTVKKGNK